MDLKAYAVQIEFVIFSDLWILTFQSAHFLTTGQGKENCGYETASGLVLYLTLFVCLFVFLQPCVDIDEWVMPCTVNFFVPNISFTDGDNEELQNIFFYQVK